MSGTNESWLGRLSSTGHVQQEAISELRDILLSRLRKTFHGRVGVDEGFLEDVVQDALLKTLESLDQFRHRSLFTTWATTIAIRVALTDLRRHRWKDVSIDQLVTDSIDQSHTTDHDLDPYTELEHRSLVQSMYQIIETELTDKQRTALLAELKGMPQAEIGRRMGSTRNAIYKLTHDARRRLKRCLEAAGYTAADLQTN